MLWNIPTQTAILQTFRSEKKQVTKHLSEQIIHVEVYKLEYWMPTHYYYTCFGPAWFIEVKVLYMSFDKFLLAVESRDPSQADKIYIMPIPSGSSIFFENDQFLLTVVKSDILDRAYFTL